MISGAGALPGKIIIETDKQEYREVKSSTYVYIPHTYAFDSCSKHSICVRFKLKLWRLPQGTDCHQ